MENILFKVSFPAEFHGQTAVEAAIKLHPSVRYSLDEVEQILIQTQESACRIINKEGRLYNAADRDHCLQYMVAVALIHGELKSKHYGDQAASDPRIDRLREKMKVVENSEFSRDYLDPEKRSIANAIRITFADGTHTENVVVEYPLGHKKRRIEAMPLLKQKMAANLATVLPEWRCDEIIELLDKPQDLEHMPVRHFMDLFVL